MSRCRRGSTGYSVLPQHERDSMRRAGILLHITSLPSRGPVGDIGPAAYGFVDWLANAGCRVWQILPVNPVGPGWCPYASPSAFAAEPALLSLDGLVSDGLLELSEVGPRPQARGEADWMSVDGWKRPLLSLAAKRLAAAEPEALAEYARSKPWAGEWALFSTLHARENRGWQDWSDAGLRARNPTDLAAARAELSGAVGEALALQLLFDRQWAALKAYARGKGVTLFGDMPLFVSGDSCDTWCDPQLFALDEAGRATEVAGAPPDAFSDDGQLWGSPVYDWSAHTAEGFSWWKRRVGRALEHVDLLRIDHFRGLQATWTIPADAETAREGTWKEVPGAAMFEALGSLPLVAEDLGIITPEVEALRAAVGCPGMRILQFAFGGDAHHGYLPHNYDANTVVYTGTHDNDTTRGWYATAGGVAQDRYRRYLGADGADVSWDFIRMAWGSVAETAIAPMQDVLDLGGEARMNVPGTEDGNWGWRLQDIPWWVEGRLLDLSESYGRLPPPKPARKDAQTDNPSDNAEA